MESFTYQASPTENRLETYEWDNVWWEHTEKRIALGFLSSVTQSPVVIVRW